MSALSKKLLYLNTFYSNPYENLALEEYLFRQVEPGQVMMYLWQNQRTVVIGRNQNPWKECHLEQLEKDGGFLARRRSGGGAVYHDLGNLNFTFIACDAEYSVTRQLDVLLAAVQKLHLNAERSGRNDITIAGRKISGNAFQSKNGRSCHHGTILIDVDRTALTRYLHVSADKMISKGVASVQARVANLREFVPDLDANQMRKLMLEAFADIYEGIPEELSVAHLNREALAALSREFASWQWRIGRPISFSQEYSHRFAWGDIQIQLRVNAGIIEEAATFSDALATDLIAALPRILQGIPFSLSDVQQAIHSFSPFDDLSAQMANDICQMLAQNLTDAEARS